ncbi:uncharacterized protein BO80DRAFT_267060 [Aspergillus ibericus CBS 121593]|uniref:Transcription factor IIIC subunit delta N-term-domain-containing protein n=1 Tax=Aspergillus ibericus CBS 121593 TaxID=1448316 RepID=A0A395H6Y7_9EURO|nr:hypothetical protein BO80DRAFT_267060 [Aspergillus ibericus CBS 121593]RAL03677.1 hypothetical protein BO80DRAFT_267060 [Aspergillus ibericus CBS 121593]
MLGPLELSLFPSCYDCLAWSADGELAIAAGEYIQILTPKNTVGQSEFDSTQSPITNWHSSRFRVNVFTNNEWPTIDPQNRDNFSLGAEQSISTVVALAWSPPGLAKYRRCVLAVLTSNLILSLYEPVGLQRKWTRVAIVNDALGNHFKSSIQDEALNLRKSNIRSFAWSPPLKLTATETASPYTVLPTESRWGWHLLSVANDDNDVIFLNVQRSPAELSTLYETGVLSVTALPETEENYSQLQPSSIFAKILKSKVKVLSMSWGPWLHALAKSQKNSASGYLAVTHGTTLRVLQLDVDLPSRSRGTNIELQTKLDATSKETTSAVCHEDLSGYHFSGPLAWLHTDDSPTLCLAAGILTGLLLINFPKKNQKGARSSGRAQVQELPFYETSKTETGASTPRHLEPITAMLVTTDTATQTPVLYGATAGGYIGAVPFHHGKNEASILPVPWQGQLDDIREKFDFDRDLGGLAVARAWGLTSYNGMVAAGITVHPGDMIEYRTAAEERLTIIISPDASQSDGATSETVDNSPDLQHRRESVLGYILHFEDNDEIRQPLSSKILYAAACCTIVESTNTALLYQAHKVLVRLATATGADVTDELSKCSISKNKIASKSAEALDGPGGQMFERCDICDAGIDWYSSQEAQCATGHIFVRCGVTSLAIQDPGASKLCSSCGREYLNEDGIESFEPDLQDTCRMLFDAFDTCVYCNGKYQV